MRKIKTAGLVLLLLAAGILSLEGSGYAKSPSPKQIRFMTEQYPPFNFKENGKLQGISVDLLELMAQRIGVGLNRRAVELLPWTEGYQRTLQMQNTALFSTTRTPERETLFKWVGPIAPTRVVLFSRKDRPCRIESPADLKGLKIGAIADDIGADLCVKAGVPKADLVLSEKAETLVRLLEEGQIDAWAYEETTGRWFINQYAAGAGDFSASNVLHEGELYYAFHRLTPEKVILTFQRTLDGLKKGQDADGSSPYEKIFDRYLKPRYIEDKITYLQMQTLTDQTAAAVAADAPAAFKAITAGEPPYRDRKNPALYVFAFDTQVNVVADADNATTVGKNYRGKTDVSGQAFRDEIVAGALKTGKGWVDYIYTNPARSGLYYKTTYYRLVQGSDGKPYIICCGKFKNKP